ncbi:MAG: hydroxyethylthiazole kinase [Desulfurella sp.]|uniref:Hydroxyethylthiazole kinase n=1 Tax=Desulfurella multipotens TaxID=79269 RepID=A0A1G6MB65_9BACT|nr:hydroxyethylthiazole kinase [Desulfurella multipotens]AHF96930.1 hydroxyethylthiazole kinase [Desulfurella acetivorans A63]SDC52226.1 hydroxyethylthiazole kinase [Desulfurella multipotens]
MEEFSKIITEIRQKSPLVYNITNFVVTNISANALLALGASPIMSYAKQEAIDLIKISSALLINMGTPTPDIIETMLIAAKTANNASIPVVFDPVGVGASKFRNEIAQEILSKVKIDIIKGNASEIANLCGVNIQTKGVESNTYIENIADLTKDLAKKHHCIVCATGKTDIVSDGNKVYACENGHEFLTKITGSGCILGSIAAAAAGVCNDYLKATVASCLIVGISGEIAASKSNLLGNFQVEFFNALSTFEPENFKNALYKVL